MHPERILVKYFMGLKPQKLSPVISSIFYGMVLYMYICMCIKYVPVDACTYKNENA